MEEHRVADVELAVDQTEYLFAFSSLGQKFLNPLSSARWSMRPIRCEPGMNCMQPLTLALGFFYIWLRDRLRDL